MHGFRFRTWIIGKFKEQPKVNKYLFVMPKTYRQVWLSLCRVTAPFPWVLVHTRFCLCPVSLWKVWGFSLMWLCPSYHLVGEGTGNSLQYSCLENPMDGRVWCRLLSMGLQRVGLNDWMNERLPFPFLYHLVKDSFVLGCGVSFFGGFQPPPVNGCSAASCDFCCSHRRRWMHILLLHHLGVYSLKHWYQAWRMEMADLIEAKNAWLHWEADRFKKREREK